MENLVLKSYSFFFPIFLIKVIGIIVTIPASTIVFEGPAMSIKYPVNGGTIIPARDMIILSIDPIVALSLFGTNLWKKTLLTGHWIS